MIATRTAWAAVSLLTLASAASALTPEELFKRASPSVWTVKADLGNNKFAIGSAVAVTPQALVTACHVVNGAASVTVAQGQASIQVSQVMRDPDPARDLCILNTAQRFALPAVEIAPIDGVKVGQPVYAIGSPHGLELTLSEGIVSALRPKAPGQLPIVQTTAPVSSGSSGGGLFDADGKLVGIADSVSPGGANLGFAHPAQWVAELPQRIDAERKQWRQTLQSLGVALKPNGDPSPSGNTEVSDLSALPKVGNAAPDAVSNAYKQFLLQARPRAFLITSDGQFGLATGSAALLEHAKGCTQRKVTCAVYAVDNAVVWGQQQPTAAK